MKKVLIIFSFLSCLSLINLNSMGKANGPEVPVYDGGSDEVEVHETSDNMPSSSTANLPIQVQVKAEKTEDKITQKQATKIVEQVKKQSWFNNLVQKIRICRDFIFTQQGFTILIVGIATGYSLAIKFGYDPLNIYPVLEKFVVEYDKIGVKEI